MSRHDDKGLIPLLEEGGIYNFYLEMGPEEKDLVWVQRPNRVLGRPGVRRRHHGGSRLGGKRKEALCGRWRRNYLVGPPNW